MNIYTYQNCYALLEEVRTELNEYNEKLCQGTELGVFDNSDIVRKINVSQKYIFNILFNRLPDLFLTSTGVTGTAGVYTIPSNIYRLSHITNSNGDRINPVSVKVKHLNNSSGSDYLYYRSGNTIVRDGGGSDTLTFHYYKIARDLTQGLSVGGSATSITLGRNARGETDFYNGVIIENISDNWVDTITDYTSARVATIATMSSAGKYYGTVSELPEAFHSLISKKAVILLKDSIVSPQRADVSELSNFREDLVETLRAVTGTGDVNPSELFYSFAPYV
jgi:hypothetical protein